MNEKIKIKIPKVNPEFLKNNLLILIVVAALALLVGDIIVWVSSQSITSQISEIRQKKEKIKQVKEKLEKIGKEKPYLKTEEFARKVPFKAIPPIAAIQQAGLIIKSCGAQGQIITSEGSAGGSTSGSSSGGTTSGSDTGEPIMVGSKSLSKQSFSFKFDSNYEDFMEILEKLLLCLRI